MSKTWNSFPPIKNRAPGRRGTGIPGGSFQPHPEGQHHAESHDFLQSLPQFQPGRQSQTVSTTATTTKNQLKNQTNKPKEREREKKKNIY